MGNGRVGLWRPFDIAFTGREVGRLRVGGLARGMKRP